MVSITWRDEILPLFAVTVFNYLQWLPLFSHISPTTIMVVQLWMGVIFELISRKNQVERWNSTPVCFDSFQLSPVVTILQPNFSYYYYSGTTVGGSDFRIDFALESSGEMKFYPSLLWQFSIISSGYLPFFRQISPITIMVVQLWMGVIFELISR